MFRFSPVVLTLLLTLISFPGLAEETRPLPACQSAFHQFRFELIQATVDCKKWVDSAQGKPTAVWFETEKKLVEIMNRIEESVNPEAVSFVGVVFKTRKVDFPYYRCADDKYKDLNQKWHLELKSRFSQYSECRTSLENTAAAASATLKHLEQMKPAKNSDARVNGSSDKSGDFDPKSLPLPRPRHGSGASQVN